MKVPDCFMVVDDDRTTTMICKSVFRRFAEHVDVKLYTVPALALTAIKEEYSEPGAIVSTVLFLDINMPSMTGWEFLEEFKKLSEHIHKQFTVLIFSSSVDERDKKKADSSPFVSGFISKPVTTSSLENIFKQE